MIRKIILGILILAATVLKSQHYSYSAAVSSMDSNNFYKLFLSPEISSKMNPNFSDIRIYDTAGIESPYILQIENPVNESLLFKEYKIIANDHYKDKAYTRIVIHNPTKSKINNIVLRIKNADVRKQLKLNASYDNENWYVLKDNYSYNSINNQQNVSEIRVLNFPLSDYEYYELLISDYYDKPIKIDQAGFYDAIKEEGKYTKIDQLTYAIADTLKKTIVKIPVHNHYIDKISFKINGPKYYKRSARIYTHNVVTNRKNVKVYDQPILDIQLISNSTNSFTFNNLQTDTLFIEINKNDDQALDIDKVNFYQLNKYLIADLSSTNAYHIEFSDKNAQKPIYDLSYFSDKIPDDIKVIEIIDMHEILGSKPKSNNLNFSNYWLWIAIIGIIALLGYMSFSMVKGSKIE